MTNKEWLNRAYNLEKYIKELKMAYNNAYENAVYISPTFGERVQKGENNGNEAKLSKCVDLLSRLEKSIDEQYAIKQEIAAAIYILKDNRHRAILTARYINFKKFEIIAEEQGYTERQVYRLYSDAVKIIKCQ